MSDVMLLGVLRMPPSIWLDQSALDVAQRHSYYVSAADRIEADAKDIANLRALNEKLQKDYVDLICQFAQFTTEATDTLIRVEKTKALLESALIHTDAEKLHTSIRAAIMQLVPEDK